MLELQDQRRLRGRPHLAGSFLHGRTFDELELLPFWQAAEQMGALIFVHQGGETLVSPRTSRYHLPNTIGNLVDRAVTFASLAFGGVMDKCPDLKVCLAHGGGSTRFGAGRVDRWWQVRSEAPSHILNPPATTWISFAMTVSPTVRLPFASSSTL